MSSKTPLKTSCLLSIILTILCAQIWFVAYVPSYGAWGIFHYYLGAKYLNELGYFDLYRCALATDASTDVWQTTTTARDLYSYRFVTRPNLGDCPRQRFTSARWHAFTQDVHSITQHAPAAYWAQVVTDKGFNPPPSWVFPASIIANHVAIDNPWTYKLLFNLDLLFILLAAAIIWRRSGSYAALLTLALTLGYFGTLMQLGNNFIQYAWFPLLAATIAAWRAHKPWLSGSALAAATALQAFPVMFAIPVALQAGLSLFSKQHRPTTTRATHFLLAFSLVLLSWSALSSIFTGGLDTWQQWRTKITQHSHYLHGEIFDLGLPTLIATATADVRTTAHSYPEDYPHVQQRLTALQQYRWLWYSSAALGVLLIVLSLWRVPTQEPFGHGYLLMYLFLALSPYYYLSLALAPWLFWHSTSHIRRFAIFGISIMFLFNIALFWNSGVVSFTYTPHLLSQISMLGFLLILTLLTLTPTQRS